LDRLEVVVPWLSPQRLTLLSRLGSWIPNGINPKVVVAVYLGAWPREYGIKRHQQLHQWQVR
tara:strand:+ start:200 stop:385 length:186 start_codon:yes stop_codon:yes gene_type:complete